MATGARAIPENVQLPCSMSAKAMKKIFVCSNGVPRVINLLCDLALLFGFIHEKREIDPTMIQQAMQEFNFYTPQNSMRRHTRPNSYAQGVHANSFRRPRRLVLVAGIV